MELKNYLLVLLRRKWVVIIMVLVTMLVVIVGTSKMTPSYIATATLRIATASASTSSSDYMFADRLINTYINIATSRPVLDELNTQLSLDYDPQISVRQIPNSELIEISVEDTNPDLAMQAANTLSFILISQSGEFYTGTGKTPADVLKDQVDKAEADLNQLRTDYYNRLAQYPNDTAGNQSAAKAVDSQQQLYFSLLSQYQQLRVKEALQSNLISFVQKAELPTSPSKPNKFMNLALGFLASVFGGIGLAFILENIDTTINSSEELGKLTELHVIGRIPIIQKGILPRIPFLKKKGETKFLLDGNSPFSEAFFRLRTNLIMLITHPPIRTLMIASALQDEGKTMVAANLAFAFSQIGKRVILVDCDVRLPSLHKIFDLPNTTGLGDYLEGNASLEEIIHETGYSDLHVIAAGQTHDSAGLLPDSLQMRNLISQLYNYDLVIFDTPAVQAVTDASEVAQLVDGVLVVVRLGLIRKETLEATLEQLANVKANIIGMVINGSKAANHYYYYKRKIIGIRGEQPNGTKQ